MSDVNETISDIARPTDLHSANIIPFQPDEGIFKVPDLPPWRLKAKETKERRRILRISDPRRKRVRRRKVRHDEDYSFLEIYKMNIEYMYAEKHESRLSMSEKASFGEDMPIGQLVEKDQEEEANLGDPMSDNDLDENETAPESNSSFEVSGEEDVDSDGECDEELEATVLKIMEKTKEFRKLNKIWKADDILDLEIYHLPQLYMKCQGKENKLPVNVQVVKIDPFMVAAEINSVGRSVIDVGLDILIELGELVLNPIAAFNEHFYLVKKRITAHSDRGDIFNRCHPRDPRIEPPVWYEFCQAAEKMSAEAKTKHPRANQYPSKFSYELIEFCEDPYWENHEGKIPDGLQIPQRPFDIEDVRNNRIPDSEAPRECSPEEIPMFINGSRDEEEQSS
ncbi:hypothetical protein L5515_018962 [Caenorhabditis briggsae]|uniref:Uncharacterized protein n=1 Tax=Caenorhabditis briggsae TaxID=6238 RepID=A0AAE9FKW9_CAEBR|nr:hypothetical protein L5515_018962 [Caenorhabditis briggsae]